MSARPGDLIAAAIRSRDDVERAALLAFLVGWFTQGVSGDKVETAIREFEASRKVAT